MKKLLKPKKLPCPYCNGTGCKTLQGAQAETLKLVKRYPGLNGAALAALSGVSGEAMANRLRSIERHGLIRCEPSGRSLLWKIL